jgi:hypothetical protein
VCTRWEIFHQNRNNSTVFEELPVKLHLRPSNPQLTPPTLQIPYCYSLIMLYHNIKELFIKKKPTTIRCNIRRGSSNNNFILLHRIGTISFKNNTRITPCLMFLIYFGTKIWRNVIGQCFVVFYLWEWKWPWINDWLNDWWVFYHKKHITLFDRCTNKHKIIF